MTNNNFDLTATLGTLRKPNQTELNNLLLGFAATGNLSAVDALLKAGAMPDAKDHFGYTPLHYAAQYGHTAIAEVLIASGAHPDAKDHFDRTPLHLAAGNGHTETAEALTVGGALPDAQDIFAQTPLHLAVRAGHTKTAALLRNPQPPSPTNNIRDAQALKQG